MRVRMKKNKKSKRFDKTARKAQQAKDKYASQVEDAEHLEEKRKQLKRQELFVKIDTK